jgi:aryl-alcohol dehydrogenase-like predicted oxidoreductase
MSTDKTSIGLELGAATRRLGGSDIMITPVGFGAWALGGGGWEFAWGPQDDSESIDAIHRALDLGVNWIDTAAVYGFGHSEEVVARSLEGRSDRPYVFTKCGLVWDAQRKTARVLAPDSVRRELDASLRRLRVDVIDLYQVHWPPANTAELEPGMEALEAARQQGKIRHIGVSNFDVALMQRARRVAQVVSLQPPYSIIRREIEHDIVPYCQREGIGVIVYSPMASGLLSGAMTRERIAQLPSDDWRRRSAAFQEPQLSRNLLVVDALRRIGARHGASTPGEVAVAWTLHNPAVTAAIVGARSARQVDGWIGAASLRLTDQDIADIPDIP